jgi:hypothetical protein
MRIVVGVGLVRAFPVVLAGIVVGTGMGMDASRIDSIGVRRNRVRGYPCGKESQQEYRPRHGMAGASHESSVNMATNRLLKIPVTGRSRRIDTIMPNRIDFIS